MKPPAAIATGVRGRADEGARRDEGADQHRGRRLHRPLHHSVRLEHREEREPFGPVALHECESPSHGVGRVTHVGVREEQPLPARPLEALLARPRLAHPPWGHRPSVQHLHPFGRGGARLCRRRVRRLVVDDDHLERAVRLARQRPERDPDPPLLVAGRHHDRDERPVGNGSTSSSDSRWRRSRTATSTLHAQGRSRTAPACVSRGEGGRGDLALVVLDRLDDAACDIGRLDPAGMRGAVPCSGRPASPVSVCGGRRSMTLILRGRTSRARARKPAETPAFAAEYATIPAVGISATIPLALATNPPGSSTGIAACASRSGSSGRGRRSPRLPPAVSPRAGRTQRPPRRR